MKRITAALLFLLTIPGLAAPKQPFFELFEAGGVRGINDAGDISGFISTEHGMVGFIKRGDDITHISPPGAFNTFAWGIDNDGRVSGTYTDAGGIAGVQRGFIYQNGQYTIVAHPEAEVSYGGTQLFGISNGRAVGLFKHAVTGQWHGFLYSNGQFTPIEVPGSSPGTTVPYGINAAGRVVGYYLGGGTDWQTEHGFAWQNGQFQTIDFPRPGAISILYALNSNTILGVVGGACDWNPFILRNGKFEDLDMPGVQAFGINEAGWIVGDFGRDRGFVAKSANFILKQKQVNP